MNLMNSLNGNTREDVIDPAAIAICQFHFLQPTETKQYQRGGGGGGKGGGQASILVD